MDAPSHATEQALPIRQHNDGTLVPPTGLTVLVDPEDPSLDIVFVHGFTGHPERTWTHKKGDAKHRVDIDGADIDVESLGKPSKAQKRSIFKKWRSEKKSSQTTDHAAVYWPKDLLPDVVPNARVLTYGYDTNIRHWAGQAMSKNTVYDHAWDFLVALEAERRLVSSRPLLFIVHSLGGIIVKEMLRRSSNCHYNQKHLRTVFEATRGIMFFGTPHGGADPRGFFQRVVERAVKAAGFSVNEQIVNSLLPSAERLRELRDEFSPVAHRKNWIIHSFQEQQGVAALNGRKVVEDTSSYLNLPEIEITEHIGRNHMQMCRFTGPDDVEYKKVAAALKRMTCEVPGQRKRSEAEGHLNAKQKKILLDSLRFDQIYSRQMNVKTAHSQTCQWLLEEQRYLQWLDPSLFKDHHGFLWIKGNPGTGKSTIMKFALADAKISLQDETVISFFFNARGDDLEKNTLGLYRSLLLQLLEKLPKLQTVFHALEVGNGITGYQWTIETLKALFRDAVLRLGESSLVCFIDALDECEDRQIRDMVSFVEGIAEIAIPQGIKFRVCFASRHYPHISIRKGLGLVLDRQEGHDQDIINYLNSELKTGDGEFAEQIRAEVRAKASGIFMWVVLVVEILNKEYDSGRVFGLRRRLQELPSDLHELFRDILTRDNRNTDELLLCIQWILFSRHPLSPEKLYFAILSGVEPDVLSSWNPEVVSMDTISRYILDCSKGLAETIKSESPTVERMHPLSMPLVNESTVQFIHESVRDFLLKEGTLSSLWPDLGDDFRGRSHDRLKQCCQTYMVIDISAVIDLTKPLSDPFTKDTVSEINAIMVSFPFLQYAIGNVLYHADAAQRCGISQLEFLSGFPTVDWIKRYDLFLEDELLRHTEKASLLYMIAQLGLSNLIRIHPRKAASLDIEEDRCGTPLLAALSVKAEDAVQALLEAYLVDQPSESQLHFLYHRFCMERRIWSPNYGFHFVFYKDRGVLSHVAQYGDWALFDFLMELRTLNPVEGDLHGYTPMSYAALSGNASVVNTLLKAGNVDLEPRNMNGRTPLWLAAAYGYEKVVKVLIETGKVDLESRDRAGRTPLLVAAAGGYDDVVTLLLAKSETNPESVDCYGRTPLWYATSWESTFKILLETGTVNPDVRAKDGRSPLSCAAAGGHHATVKALLEIAEVEPDSRDNQGRTPLSYAAERDFKEIVELLLGTGKVDPDSMDYEDRTPLSYAAELGCDEIVQLLIESDRVIIDSRDCRGRTPMSYAAQLLRKSTVKILMETKKVDPKLSDSCGETPVSYASRNHTGREMFKDLDESDNLNPNSDSNSEKQRMDSLGSTQNVATCTS